MGKQVRRAESSRAKTTNRNALPKWNLSDLFAGQDDKRIAATMRAAKKSAEGFRRKYAGKVERQLRTADAFLKMIHEYEDLMILSSKPYHYASLLFSESVMVSGRGALLQKIRTEYVQISNTLAFFSPELLAVDKSKLQKLAKNKALSEYHNYIASLIQYQRHELPEREKQIFSDLSLTGSSALNRMYDEEFAAREYEIKRGKKASFHSLSEALDLLHSSDRATRQAAQAGFSNGLIEDSRRITLIFNTLLQDKQVRDRYHKFENPEDARHLENQIPMKVVDALVRATKQSYRDVARFYEFKRDLLGYKKLYDYDRYAPIGHGRKIPWNDAKNYVIEAFEDFHPEFGRIAKEFFTRRWIDAEARPGKRGGAFCSFVTPDLHPYVFMNYGGTERDVFTLAHELGHAIHAYLMREQRYLNFDTPLTIAETASVFAELLLFYSLVDKMRSQEAKLALRVHHLENLIATIHRQVSMFLFERDVHAARRKGELHTEDFNRIWRARQEEMFRGSVELTPGYDYWWSYVPHFVHTPFYVYAYSFGQLFALGLYEKFEHQPEPFAQRYIEFLRSGNSKSPVELGHLLGVNLSRPEIWQNGVKTFRKMLLETEKLAG